MLSKERKAMERYHHYYDRFDLLFVITSKIIFKGKVTQSDTAIGAGQGNGCEKIADNRRQFNKHTNGPTSIQAHAKNIQKHAQTCNQVFWTHKLTNTHKQVPTIHTKLQTYTQTGTVHSQTYKPTHKQVLDTHKLTNIHTNRYYTHTNLQTYTQTGTIHTQTYKHTHKQVLDTHKLTNIHTNLQTYTQTGTGHTQTYKHTHKQVLDPQKKQRA